LIKEEEVHNNKEMRGSAMRKALDCLVTLAVALSSLSSPCAAFLAHPVERGRPFRVWQATDRRMGELTSSEEKVFDLLRSLHTAKYSFRIVVVGNGAILETTSELGPAMKVSQSPKTGKNLLTLASDDKSFEFHLQLADVAEIVLLEKKTPAKIMRLIRLLSTEGQSMCSLILADDSDAAVEWYTDLRETYGETINLI
jgi:hypothetical protein